MKPRTKIFNRDAYAFSRNNKNPIHGTLIKSSAKSTKGNYITNNSNNNNANKNNINNTNNNASFYSGNGSAFVMQPTNKFYIKRNNNAKIDNGKSPPNFVNLPKAINAATNLLPKPIIEIIDNNRPAISHRAVAPKKPAITNNSSNFKSIIEMISSNEKSSARYSLKKKSYDNKKLQPNNSPQISSEDLLSKNLSQAIVTNLMEEFSSTTTFLSSLNLMDGKEKMAAERDKQINTNGDGDDVFLDCTKYSEKTSENEVFSDCKIETADLMPRITCNQAVQTDNPPSPPKLVDNSQKKCENCDSVKAHLDNDCDIFYDCIEHDEIFKDRNVMNAYDELSRSFFYHLLNAKPVTDENGLPDPIRQFKEMWTLCSESQHKEPEPPKKSTEITKNCENQRINDSGQVVAKEFSEHGYYEGDKDVFYDCVEQSGGSCVLHHQIPLQADMFRHGECLIHGAQFTAKTKNYSHIQISIDPVTLTLPMTLRLPKHQQQHKHNSFKKPENAIDKNNIKILPKKELKQRIPRPQQTPVPTNHIKSGNETSGNKITTAIGFMDGYTQRNPVKQRQQQQQQQQQHQQPEQSYQKRKQRQTYSFVEKELQSSSHLLEPERENNYESRKPMHAEIAKRAAASPRRPPPLPIKNQITDISDDRRTPIHTSVVPARRTNTPERSANLFSGLDSRVSAGSNIPEYGSVSQYLDGKCSSSKTFAQPMKENSLKSTETYIGTRLTQSIPLSYDEEGEWTFVSKVTMKENIKERPTTYTRLPADDSISILFTSDDRQDLQTTEDAERDFEWPLPPSDIVSRDDEIFRLS